MSERFARMFEGLREKKEAAFVPFVTLCDPNFETSLEILKTLVKSGADALELGMPFSDPCADGPVIQKANKRALTSGSSTNRCFALVKMLRKDFPDTPVSLLVYSNLVKARTLKRFYHDARMSGIDAVLVPDVPYDMIENERENFRQCASDSNVDLVLIAPPNASDERIAQIAEASQGYTYVVSRFGITGDRNKAGVPREIIAKLKEHHSPPTLLGFGISDTDDVRNAIEGGHIDGVISGSRVVRIIEENLGDKEKMLAEISAFVKKMKAATRI